MRQEGWHLVQTTCTGCYPIPDLPICSWTCTSYIAGTDMRSPFDNQEAYGEVMEIFSLSSSKSPNLSLPLQCSAQPILEQIHAIAVERVWGTCSGKKQDIWEHKCCFFLMFQYRFSTSHSSCLPVNLYPCTYKIM